MSDREPESWESSVPGTFMTLRTGGPFDGTVTLTITTATEGRLLVEARWRIDGERRTATVKCEEFHEARGLAHQWAAQLGMGREPRR